MRSIAVAFTLVVLAAWAGVPVEAAPQNLVLGSGGEVYQVHLGNRSEIFPASSDSDTFLLALEVKHQDGSSDLMVIPDTDTGEDVESSAALIFEESSQTLFVVWDSRVNYIHSVLKVASFDGETWSDPISVRGGWLTPRGTPQIAVTRDKYDVEIDGESQIIQRTILHLAWWEASDEGDAVLYTPIILENGVYLGDHSVISMADLEQSGESGLGAYLSEELIRTVAIRNGRDVDTVLIGFVDPLTSQIRTVEVRPTPGAISQVADGLRPRMVEFGSEADIREDLPALAAQARQEVVQLSIRSSLNPGVRAYLAQQVYQLVLNVEPSTFDAATLASDARSLIVELGNMLLSDRLVNVSDALRPRMVEFGDRTGGTVGPSHIFTTRVLSSRPAPSTPAAPTSMYLSADGREILVAWQQEDRLSYFESAPDGWSAEASLLFGPGTLDLESAYEILQQRGESR